MNRSYLYWKWNHDIFDPDVMEQKVKDLTSRTEIGNIFIGMEWIHEDFCGPNITKAFKHGIDLLHKAGRKVMIECCIRGEGEEFYKSYPYEPAYLVSVYEGVADADGKISVPHEPVYHYWRKTGEHGEHKLYGAYRLTKSGEHSYSAAEKLDDAESRAVAEGEGFAIEIASASLKEGDTVAVALGFPQPLPDLAHPMLIPYFRKMAEHAKEVGADGVFSDEWGYDIILKIETPNPYDDWKLSIRHLSYSDYFEKEFVKETGESLKEHFIDLFYEGSEKRKDLIDGYMRAMRLICTRNEDGMYAAVKEIMGPDAFWGIHPTWWGNATKQYFEFFKNGFYWWDAARDIAQTDEMVSLPIRTALAHRFASPVWYNMWYSMGTRSIAGYFPETWNNLRYGGRTHHLGYECPNESVVLEFKPRGLLESIERIEKRVRLFDDVCQQPDCRLLLFFGFEAVSNWADVGREAPWGPESPRLMKVLTSCNELFPQMLCDLVPSYSVENGSLFINENRKAQYGTQEYDAVIAYYPQRLTQQAKDFLRGLNAKALVICDGPEFADLAEKGAVVLDDVPPAANLMYIAEAVGAMANRSEEGCVFQDGSVMYATSGQKPTGNKLSIHEELGGLRIDFEGEDALWVSADGLRAIYPAGELSVNGKKILSER